jgi:hypothetical protein
LISKLNGVTFEWDSDNHPDRKFKEGSRMGFIAQDVRQVLPDVVSEDDSGMLSMSYDEIVPLLVEAIKEQQSKIEQLCSALGERCVFSDQ